MLALYYLVTETTALDAPLRRAAPIAARCRARGAFIARMAAPFLSRHLLRYLASLVHVPADRRPPRSTEALGAFTEDGSTERPPAWLPGALRGAASAPRPGEAERMCGIVGFFDPDHRIDPARYEAIAGAMADRLVHRGPDDRGVWSDPDAGIALGFRRLSILDLSPAGISRCCRPTAASSWSSTARSTITASCAARSTHEGVTLARP